jgi:pilus assembly protein Flp/PilA
MLLTSPTRLHRHGVVRGARSSSTVIASTTWHRRQRARCQVIRHRRTRDASHSKHRLDDRLAIPGITRCSSHAPCSVIVETVHSSEQFDDFAPHTAFGSAVAQVEGTGASSPQRSSKHMTSVLLRLVRNDEGQDLIEYVLIGTLVSIAVVGGATALGTQLDAWYTALSGWVGTQAGNVP